MFFSDWGDLWRALIKSSVAYVAMVCVLRLSGKRTLAKLNAFDLVVTVALGSVLATVSLASDVSVLEGSAVIGVLCLAQFAVTTASVRWSPARRAIRSEPVLVVSDGEVLHAAVSNARLTVNEVHQAVRSNGVGDFESVAAVVLETDGTLSVITRQQCRTGSALVDVVRMPVRRS